MFGSKDALIAELRARIDAERGTANAMSMHLVDTQLAAVRLRRDLKEQIKANTTLWNRLNRICHAVNDDVPLAQEEE